MGYLLTQMFLYILGAFLLGLLLGWIRWGRFSAHIASLEGENARLRGDTERLKAEIEACGRARAELERRLRESDAALTSLRSRPASAPAAAAQPAPAADPQPAAALVSVPVAKAAAKPAPKPAAKPAAPKKPAASVKAAAAPKVAAPKAAAPKKAPAPKKAAAPKVAAAPVKPDNLRRMIGIGPVNEKKLHGLDVRTFAQIAAWTAADIKRVEAVLEFDGRIDRERWIEQAKLLAAGDDKEFLRRFPTAGTDKNT